MASDATATSVVTDPKPKIDRYPEIVFTVLGSLRSRYMTTKTSLPMLSNSTPATIVENVDLTAYDVIVVSTSGGKDSQVALGKTVEMARELGILDRIVAVHADLGRVEWQGTHELAAKQAAAYGIPFHIVSRIGKVSTGRFNPKKNVQPLYAQGEEYGDLLDQVRHRHAQLQAKGENVAPWMSKTTRFCTSEFKRGPLGSFFTQVSREWRKANREIAKTRPCRILDIQGIRSEESKTRAGYDNVSVRNSTKNQHVVTWYPIQDMTEEQVWAYIRKSGVPHHPAYDAGMPRLSCVFCFFAKKDALMIAGKHNPKLLAEYVAVEQETGFSFKADLALADIQAELQAGAAVPQKATDWEDAA